MSKFYATNAIPYVNAKPHIGHAYEFVLSDIIARHHKLKGDQTLLLCGGDENALKNVQAAEKEGVPIQGFVDKNSQLFLNLAKKLNVNFNVFQKGSAKDHKEASQKLWELCKHDIYKKAYTGLYCVGCEQFYEQDELDENGECFEHPGKKLEEVSEENYFFSLSKYGDEIKDLIESGELKIFPDIRKNEILSFLKQGLKDISISRTNERAKNWGVTVPGDESQKMYVWFDALNIYQSGIGFGANEEEYKKWWPADVHVLGKGIIRFHAIYWPAFLLSAGLQLPKSLFVHGYLTIEGQKMSKTIGNVVDPLEMIKKYGAETLRYYFAREVSSASDGDFSEKRLIEIYNSELANSLGNLVSRVIALVNKYCDGKIPEVKNRDLDSHPLRVSKDIYTWKDSWQVFSEYMPNYKFNEVLKSIWKFIDTANKYVNENKPWELAEKNKDEFNWVIYGLLDSIHQIAWLINPFLPETSAKIAETLNIEGLLKENPSNKDSWTNIKPRTKLKPCPPLFPRIK
ncbi:methionine--tRNA ligase [Patescibacteria group bacterium]|nr:methionine--tRNA ligase [Patescibacteria group bacterium]